jgi:hypothetical protein
VCRVVPASMYGEKQPTEVTNLPAVEAMPPTEAGLIAASVAAGVGEDAGSAMLACQVNPNQSYIF